MENSALNGLISFAVAVFLFVLARNLSAKRKAGGADPAIYPLMRSQLFKLKAEDIKLGSWNPGKPFCIIMETGYPGATVTFSACAEGSTSLYLSNGGGFIGAGERAHVRSAVLAFIERSAAFLPHASKVTNYPLPGLGRVNVYFKTPEALSLFSDSEINLGERKSPLSELFYEAQRIIALIREIDEAKKGKIVPPEASSENDAAMNGELIRFIQANRNRPMGKVLKELVPMLMASEMVFANVSEEPAGQGEKIVKFMTNRDEGGKVWFQGYLNTQELLKVYPAGTPYGVLKFSDFIKAIQSTADLGGIAINGGSNDSILVIPEPLFYHFKK